MSHQRFQARSTQAQVFAPASGVAVACAYALALVCVLVFALIQNMAESPV